MIRTVCNTCGYERAKPIQQSPGPASDPGPGDFWLCKCCGTIHRYKPVLAGRGVMRLVATRCADVALEDLPPTDRAALLSERKRIRGGIS